jgi:hypothetical protein
MNYFEIRSQVLEAAEDIHVVADFETHNFKDSSFIYSFTCFLFKAWTVFARLNTGIVGSNPTLVMVVGVLVICVSVVLCVGIGLAKGWSPAQGVLSSNYRIKELKSLQGLTEVL